MSSTLPSPTSSPADALASELTHALAVLGRLGDELAELLADPDAIQEDRDAAAQLVEDARRHVVELQQAEQRLTTGRYGRCVVCGKAIDPERLQALPDAETCVGCS